MNINCIRNKYLILVALILNEVAAIAQPSFIPAAPYTVTVIQPDGTELDIQGVGDENRHFT